MNGSWCVDASHSGHISFSSAWPWFSSGFSCSKEANKANEWLDCKVFGFDAINFEMGNEHENLSISYLWARIELGPIHDSPMLKAQGQKCIHVKREKNCHRLCWTLNIFRHQSNRYNLWTSDFIIHSVIIEHFIIITAFTTSITILLSFDTLQLAWWLCATPQHGNESHFVATGTDGE